MIDITSITDDINVFDTQAPRAGNILSVQVGSLEYEPTLGIDLKYFLSEDFRFQNESFKSYLIQVLSNYGVNVAGVIDIIESLFVKYTFEITPAESGTSLIAR